MRFKKAEKRAKLDREEQRKKEKADAQKAKRDKEKAAKEAVEKIERDKAQLAKDDIEAARNARKKFTKQCKRLQIFEEDGADGGTSSVSREQADHLRTTLPTEQLVAIAKLQDKAAFTVRARVCRSRWCLSCTSPADVRADLTSRPACACLVHSQPCWWRSTRWRRSKERRRRPQSLGRRTSKSFLRRHFALCQKALRIDGTRLQRVSR